ncbi:hypothetical protein HMPREF3156_00563 [Neisseria sp. HMSC06F02]|nr:hypothetical protein HMPREF3156_00563 [Neisseria sp. HMSC06F02]
MPKAAAWHPMRLYRWMGLLLMLNLMSIPFQQKAKMCLQRENWFTAKM